MPHRAKKGRLTMAARNDVVEPSPHPADLLPDPGFFEGAEKLLEIVFVTSDTARHTTKPSQRCGLRQIGRADWADMLSLVKCEIVSETNNDDVDAFVLSESSLFVFADKIILKTCGTTTLLNALDRILGMAQACGLKQVAHIFFSRKNFLEPDRQQHPHGCFDQEVTTLKAHFPHGRAFTLGDLDGDHWCLFTADAPSLALPDLPSSVPVSPDQTLEILMHDLDHERMRPFYRGPQFVSSRHSSEVSGIADLMPGAILDDLVFTPCGYSSNAILGPYYFTIHITPQSKCSFASFETNMPMKECPGLLDRVIDIFRPKRFMVTLLANKAALRETQNWMGAHPELAGFRHTSSTYEVGTHYHVAFARYTVDPVRQESDKVVRETLPWCYASPEVTVFDATV